VARVRRRSMTMAKTGFALAIVSGVSALLAAVFIGQKWNMGDMRIEPMQSLRQTAILATLAVAVVGGFAALLMGLEGAAECQGRLKTMGWIGFAVGALACMAGIVLGLAFKFYRI